MGTRGSDPSTPMLAVMPISEVPTRSATDRLGTVKIGFAANTGVDKGGSSYSEPLSARPPMNDPCNRHRNSHLPRHNQSNSRQDSATSGAKFGWAPPHAGNGLLSAKSGALSRVRGWFGSGGAWFELIWGHADQFRSCAFPNWGDFAPVFGGLDTCRSNWG